MKVTFAISPCPNDTFMFGALALGLIRIPGIEPVFSYLDIEKLNQQAMKGKFDISKISMATWITIKNTHKLLKAGAALSENCGPLLVARTDTFWPPDSPKTCVIPGKHTTAHLLLRLWDSHNILKKFVPYDKVMDMVIKKEADYGLIIHESRFLAEEKGLKVVSDLGQWWKETTDLPIPLGCLVASSRLPEDLIKIIEEKIQESISFARDHQKTIMNYIKEHAVELDDQIINKHIQTFVNEQSMELDTRGQKAIAKLEELATDERHFNPPRQTKKTR